MATDPVCRMTVDEKSAAGTSVYEGKTYYFCCQHCRTQFEKNPSAFIGAEQHPQSGKPAHRPTS